MPVAQGGSKLVAQGRGTHVIVDGYARAPEGLLALAGNQVVGNNGSNVVGNNGSNVVGNNGSNVVGNNGSNLIAGAVGGYALLQTSTKPAVALQETEVYLTDLTGVPLAGAEPTATDRQGHYVFSVRKGLSFLVAARVIRATEQPGAAGVGQVLRTLARANSGTNRHDVTLGSTLATAWVLNRSSTDTRVNTLGNPRLFDTFNALSPALEQALTGSVARLDEELAQENKAIKALLDALQATLPGSPTGRPSATTPPGYRVSTLAGGQDDLLLKNIRSIKWDRSGVLYATARHLFLQINAAGTVTTVAGSNSPGYADGVGGNAQFALLSDLTIDNSGQVYVADPINNRVRKILPNGIVLTLAGLATAGSEDGLVAVARFSNPAGIAVDGAGNVFVADHQSARIRKISPSGVVSTIAGSTAGYADGLGSTAQFSFPSGLAVDGAGNVLVADKGNHCIRKISPSGVVSTVAGSTAGYADGLGSTAQFHSPWDVEVDQTGNLFVADWLNHRIRMITPAGMVSTIAGSGTKGYADGPALAATFDSPTGIAVDQDGQIYVADSLNNRIRKISR